MAIFYADKPFNVATLNFHRIRKGEIATDFENNVNIEVENATYEDLHSTIWKVSGKTYSSGFLGKGLTVDA